jgi:hypothetical protein
MFITFGRRSSALCGFVMRTTLSLLALLPFLCGPKSYAQGEPPLAPGAQLLGPQQPAQQFLAEDGGARGDTLESIVIPPKANAPFSLLLQTEWVRTLPDGGTITTENQRRIARDTNGRIYQERWFMVPKNAKFTSQMTTIQIADPNAHTLYTCFMLDGMNQCVLSGYSPSTSAVYNFQGPPTGKLADDAGSVNP